jgi:hypothetical protein
MPGIGVATGVGTRRIAAAGGRRSEGPSAGAFSEADAPTPRQSGLAAVSRTSIEPEEIPSGPSGSGAAPRYAHLSAGRGGTSRGRGGTNCVPRGVQVGVTVGVAVGVTVGVAVGVLVGVFVGVRVDVGVTVGVPVGVLVGVNVGVSVGVNV